MDTLQAVDAQKEKPVQHKPHCTGSLGSGVTLLLSGNGADPPEIHVPASGQGPTL